MGTSLLQTITAINFIEDHPQFCVSLLATYL